MGSFTTSGWGQVERNFQEQRRAALQNARNAYDQMARMQSYTPAVQELRLAGMQYQMMRNTPIAPDNRPEWLKAACRACDDLAATLRQYEIERKLDWKHINHDLPLLKEAYEKAPDAPETIAAGNALTAAAKRAKARVYERREMQGVAAAEALLSKLAE